MVDNTLFNLKKFDVGTIADHSAICMIAKRGSGKSFCLRDLMSRFTIPCGVVIAPTDKLNGFYDSFVPSCFIYYEYDPHILINLFKRQEYIIEKNKQRIIQGKKPIDTRAFLIMDDCLASKGSWAKDRYILELLQNGRHYHILYILTMQFSLGISPELRSNFDYVFLCGEDFITNQKRLFEHYAGMFPSFEVFKKVFNIVTDDFGIMVLNNKIRSKNINEKVFWYKALSPPKFIVGSEKYKKFNEKNFDPNWNKKEKLFDVDDYLNKKQKLLIEVKLDDAK